jgi:hypothetical protein
MKFKVGDGVRFVGWGGYFPDEYPNGRTGEIQAISGKQFVYDVEVTAAERDPEIDRQAGMSWPCNEDELELL